MAFDLNKNNGADPDTGKKSTSAKFDHSKGNIGGDNPPAAPSKSRNLIIGLAGLLIVGGGIWYYSATRSTGTDPVAANNASTETNASTELKPSDTTLATPTANQADKGSPAVVENTVAVPEQSSSGNDNPVKTKLNHKIPATFARGSSSFNQIDQSLIKRIVSYLTENPGAAIQVNGYASSDGTLEINQTVSQARADAFKKYLVSKNIDENRILASGKGIENPIASNNTNAGRKKNRRVEIILP
jgi:outer membrane protein OmpA-like peptidoglycan-associated protein